MHGIGDLAAALAGRRKYVDATSQSMESSGVGKLSSASHDSARAALLALGSIPPRPESGYAGIQNQGATCYLNSLLQVMYCTNDFRQKLYGEFCCYA